MADPVVSRCKIFESFACGVRVTERGKGLYTDNDIFGCYTANVRVMTRQSPSSAITLFMMAGVCVWRGEGGGVSIID